MEAGTRPDERRSHWARGGPRVSRFDTGAPPMDESKHPVLHLPAPDAPPPERYVMPNPDALAEAYARAYHAVWWRKEAPAIEDIKALLSLADGYRSLTTYPLGQECCVDKLRDIWRARRRIAKESSP